MLKNINQLATYINSCSRGYITKQDIERVNTINASSYLLSDDYLTVPTLILWAYSQERKVIIVTSSQYDKLLIKSVTDKFLRLSEFNDVTVALPSEISNLEDEAIYFYTNMNDFTIKPFDNYIGTNINSHYNILLNKITYNHYKELVNQNLIEVDQLMNLDISDNGWLVIEKLLDTKFENYPYLYTYVIAFLISNYVLELNMDYELYDNKVNMSGNYSRLHSRFTQLYQLIVSFLYEKHNLINLPTFYEKQPYTSHNILSENIKGAYLNYSNAKQRTLFCIDDSKRVSIVLQVASKLQDKLIVIICDNKTKALATGIKRQLQKLGKNSLVTSPLLTLRDDSWCVIDITNQPLLIKSDYKILKIENKENIKKSERELKRIYSASVSQYNKSYKTNSDLNYINSNILLQLRDTWFGKYENSDIYSLHMLENEYLAHAYNKFKRYKNLMDYSNSMQSIMKELLSDSSIS